MLNEKGKEEIKGGKKKEEKEIKRREGKGD